MLHFRGQSVLLRGERIVPELFWATMNKLFIGVGMAVATWKTHFTGVTASLCCFAAP